jgi:hypothetical protein
VESFLPLVQNSSRSIMDVFRDPWFIGIFSALITAILLKVVPYIWRQVITRLAHTIASTIRQFLTGHIDRRIETIELKLDSMDKDVILLRRRQTELRKVVRQLQGIIDQQAQVSNDTLEKNDPGDCGGNIP